MSLRSLDKLATADKILNGTDPSGNFQFLTNLLLPSEGTDTKGLIGKQIVAMGLTEVCCGEGYGKVSERNARTGSANN